MKAIALLLMLLTAEHDQPTTYPPGKNICWLASGQLKGLDEVLSFMDTEISEWAATNSRLLHYYSGGLRWYVVYPEPSYSLKCTQKVHR